MKGGGGTGKEPGSYLCLCVGARGDKDLDQWSNLPLNQIQEENDHLVIDFSAHQTRALHSLLFELANQFPGKIGLFSNSPHF